MAVPDRRDWLGPLGLVLGVLSWLALIGGPVLAVAAVGCGIVSTLSTTRTDWMAVAGAIAGMAQLVVSCMLLIATSA